uniref:Predicted protein n=1 Tax=Hordeum vulgare subsp. vulgare TaxID=112509 RepID=F2D3X0_HORVV|nr:predicted protein [Hordeum vulgare subsp. vulgare]
MTGATAGDREANSSHAMAARITLSDLAVVGDGTADPGYSLGAHL